MLRRIGWNVRRIVITQDVILKYTECIHSDFESVYDAHPKRVERDDILKEAQRFSLACLGFSFLFRGVQRGNFFQRKRSEIMKGDELLISARGLPWQKAISACRSRSMSDSAITRKSRSVSSFCAGERSRLSRMRIRSIASFYSILSARIGSVEAARRAGTIAAIVAATKSSSMLPPTASGSMTGV
jgi:hypothetical protein